MKSKEVSSPCAKRGELEVSILKLPSSISPLFRDKSATTVITVVIINVLKGKLNIRIKNRMNMKLS